MLTYAARVLKALSCLANGVPIVGWGETFWRVGRFFFFKKTGVTRKRKVENRSEGAKSTVLPRATNGPLTKSGVHSPFQRGKENLEEQQLCICMYDPVFLTSSVFNGIFQTNNIMT